MSYLEFITYSKNDRTSTDVHMHHIIPKSEGGSDDESNLIALTPAQHFWAHILYDRENGTKTATRFKNFSHIEPQSYEDCLPFNEIEEKRRKDLSMKMKGKKYHLGHHLSDEQKENVSKALKGKSLNHPSFSKKVQQYTLDGQFIAEYPSVAEAGRQLGIVDQSISGCCRGSQKTYHGFLWKYSNDPRPIEPIKADTPVVQYTKSGDFVAKYKSLKEVYHQGFGYHVKKCCDGITKTCSGYIWRYA